MRYFSFGPETSVASMATKGSQHKVGKGDYEIELDALYAKLDAVFVEHRALLTIAQEIAAEIDRLTEAQKCNAT